MTAQRWSPRERMVYSAAQLIRERGVTGTGVRDVVERAEAPRGSFQHYFPDGKHQLVAEALRLSGEYAASWAARYAETARRPRPSGLFAHLMDYWQRELARHDFERGCPIMATAADTLATDGALAEPLRAALARWEGAVADALQATGVPRPRCRTLATLMLSTLEGAVLLARVHGSTRPLSTVVRELGPLLDDAVD
jgi:AcrR family transcriptional regulator